MLLLTKLKLIKNYKRKQNKRKIKITKWNFYKTFQLYFNLLKKTKKHLYYKSNIINNFHFFFYNLLFNFNLFTFYKYLIKRKSYLNKKNIGYLTLITKKNNIFGLLSNKNEKLKYWCTPASLKLLKKKKTRKFNIENIMDDLVIKLKQYKLNKVHVKFYGKRLQSKKLINKLKNTSYRVKILSISKSLNVVFNGCKLGKQKRKKKRMKFSFPFKFRINFYKKNFIKNKFLN